MKTRLLRLKSWHGQDWTKLVRYDRLLVKSTPKIYIDYKVKVVKICKSKSRIWAGSTHWPELVHELQSAFHIRYVECKAK